VKTPSELIYAYEQGERVPDDAFIRAAKTLDQIQSLLSGQEWDSDTCNAIAGVMAAEGYEIKDVPTVPAGATHTDPEGNYWSIPRPEDADGTGEIWTDGGWRTSEISGRFVDSLRAL